MFASHILGEILLTTSTHQIILFKYAKVGQTFQQMFIQQRCSVGKSRKKLQHESYQRQNTQS